MLWRQLSNEMEPVPVTSQVESSWKNSFWTGIQINSEKLRNNVSMCNGCPIGTNWEKESASMLAIRKDLSSTSFVSSAFLTFFAFRFWVMITCVVDWLGIVPMEDAPCKLWWGWGMSCLVEWSVWGSSKWGLYVLVFRKWAVGNQKLRALSCRAQTAIIS